MIHPASINLQQLVREGRFDEAVDLCHTGLRHDYDPQYRETQLGYVYFLNEANAETWHNEAPSTFEHLTQKYPLDANAYFWLGYIYDIVCSSPEEAIKTLRQALTLEPAHPYAQLVLAGLVLPPESYTSLEHVLKVQPTNIRVLQQLLDYYLAAGENAKASTLLKTIASSDPFIETQYGIMNTYINDVLTGANHTKYKQE